jgi:hypothetical protein
VELEGDLGAVRELEGEQKSLPDRKETMEKTSKENYYYLDATLTYSYARALYKYPQSGFPHR